MTTQGVKFRRVHGRIVPIHEKSVSSSVQKVKILSRVSPTAKLSNSNTFKLASYGTQIVSGAVAAMPTRSKIGTLANFAASTGLDILAGALQARSASLVSGNRFRKAKVFAEQQAIGTTIGYATFGAGLLANPKSRGMFAKYASKGINFFKGRRW